LDARPVSQQKRVTIGSASMWQVTSTSLFASTARSRRWWSLR